MDLGLGFIVLRGAAGFCRYARVHRSTLSRCGAKWGGREPDVALFGMEWAIPGHSSPAQSSPAIGLGWSGAVLFVL
eukprot:9818266-Lingulodinium_polyedra.AAC.1